MLWDYNIGLMFCGLCMKPLLYPVGSKHYQTIFLVDGKWPRRKFKTIAYNYVQYGTCGVRVILYGLHLNKCEKGQQKL